MDVYVNFHDEKDFFLGSQYAPPKQFSAKPIYQGTFNYEYASFDDLPDFNYTLTKT